MAVLHLNRKSVPGKCKQKGGRPVFSLTVTGIKLLQSTVYAFWMNHIQFYLLLHFLQSADYCGLQLLISHEIIKYNCQWWISAVCTNQIKADIMTKLFIFPLFFYNEVMPSKGALMVLLTWPLFVHQRGGFSRAINDFNFRRLWGEPLAICLLKARKNEVWSSLGKDYASVP